MKIDLYGDGIGSVEYVQHMGEDITVVNSARVSFGKHKGKTVDEVLEKEPGYFGWLLNADFPLYTKKVLTALRLRKLNSGS